MSDQPDDARRTPSLGEWEHRTIIDVPLDDDLTVKVRLPDLGEWIAQGRIPNPLRQIAEQMEFGIVQPQNLEDDDREAYFALRAFIIATHLVDPNLVEELGEEEAVEWVRSGKMPPNHRDLIWMRMFHVVPGEVFESLAGLVPFRDERSGLAAVSGGGDGGHSPE